MPMLNQPTSPGISVAGRFFVHNRTLFYGSLMKV
jgi:hypothetical protein